MTERTIAARVHGRFLTVAPAEPGPAPFLVGFHGYAEDAEAQMERLRAMPGSDRWILVSIQALHRFYQRRSDRVVASWMTRQDRERAIADNTAYVESCLEAVATEWPAPPQVVFAGFSQGVGMAFRAAAHTSRAVAGVIAVGGDIPPELTDDDLRRVRAVLIVRGASDALYKPEMFARDLQRLNESGVIVQSLEFDGGHEWSDPVRNAAAAFLSEQRGLDLLD